jgi:hypothetical protein
MSEEVETEVGKIHRERLSLLVQQDNLKAEIAERAHSLKVVTARLLQIRANLDGSDLAAKDHQAVIAQIGKHVMDGLAEAAVQHADALPE